MKQRFLSILLIVSTITMLHAENTLITNTTVLCNKPDKDKFLIQLNSNSLDLTEDAVVDNTGGYVDIPEDRYYLKTDQKIYKLQAKVVRTDNLNQLQAFINSQDLKSIKDFQKITLIQKIDLEEKNNSNQKQNITTTNIIHISFNQSSLKKAYQECKIH